MQYFFIAGNIASIAALIGFLLQLGGFTNDNILKYVTYGFVLATAAFWLYFYLSPSNRVSKAIRDRLDFSGKYSDSANRQIEIVEGEFEAKQLGLLVIQLPPFEESPKVKIFPTSSRNVHDQPSVADVTKDTLEINITSTSSYGTWKYRARGTLLSPVKAGS
jgi:hypothetical protein